MIDLDVNCKIVERGFSERSLEMVVEVEEGTEGKGAGGV